MQNVGIKLTATDEASAVFASAENAANRFKAQVSESSNGLDRIGVSAAQTANALRQVPAQLTDIVVGLQSGQAPLSVLLQQGGQLKDMFGGVGNAAKALGGYLGGLVNPYSLLAAAAVGLGYVYSKGADEAHAYWPMKSNARP